MNWMNWGPPHFQRNKWIEWIEGTHIFKEMKEMNEIIEMNELRKPTLSKKWKK